MATDTRLGTGAAYVHARIVRVMLALLARGTLCKHVGVRKPARLIEKQTQTLPNPSQRCKAVGMRRPARLKEKQTDTLAQQLGMHHKFKIIRRPPASSV